MLAIVATVLRVSITIRLVELVLPKVQQLQVSSALNVVLRILGDHSGVLHVELLALVAAGAFVGVDQVAHALVVSRTVVQTAHTHQTIPARPSRLLIVPLERLRQTVVEHEAHIRLVDAHSERYRGTDYQEIVLDP